MVSIFTHQDEFVRPELVSPMVRWLIPKEKKPISELVDYVSVEKGMYIIEGEKE